MSNTPKASTGRTIPQNLTLTHNLTRKAATHDAGGSGTIRKEK